jgi:PhnB protein
MAWQIVPYLVVADGEAAIAFYTRAFGARELMRMQDPDGRVAHAELDLHGSLLYVGSPATPPQPLGDNPPVLLHVEVEGVDAVMQTALDAGAALTRPLADQEYGARNGAVTDPFGYTWYLSSALTPAAAD